MGKLIKIMKKLKWERIKREDDHLEKNVDEQT